MHSRQTALPLRKFRLLQAAKASLSGGGTNADDSEQQDSTKSISTKSFSTQNVKTCCAKNNAFSSRAMKHINPATSSARWLLTKLLNKRRRRTDPLAQAVLARCVHVCQRKEEKAVLEELTSFFPQLLQRKQHLTPPKKTAFLLFAICSAMKGQKFLRREPAQTAFRNIISLSNRVCSPENLPPLRKF